MYLKKHSMKLKVKSCRFWSIMDLSYFRVKSLGVLIVGFHLLGLRLCALSKSITQLRKVHHETWKWLKVR